MGRITYELLDIVEEKQLGNVNKYRDSAMWLGVNFPTISNFRFTLRRIINH